MAKVDDSPVYMNLNLPVYAALAADLSLVPKHCISKFTAASRGFPATARFSCYRGV